VRTADEDLPTVHTAEFLLAHIDPKPQRVLEVGCGRGRVASTLAAAGYTVVGVDSDAGEVAVARAAGVDARLSSWLDFDDERAYDAIVFSRSLHHLQPLDDTLDHAVRHVRVGGLVLVEDFAFSESAPKTIDWFRELLKSSQARGWIASNVAADECFAGRLLRMGVDAWHTPHAERLHTAKEMSAALEQRFVVTASYDVPYLYRYTVALFANGSPAAREHVRWAFDEEDRAGRDGRAQWIGRRFVCRRSR
jgi:2-polyprenyl-3-methyl-5-hydroxy-6-metoxy-1,4-benzoquinol methylase